jgi:hypothetical protein
MGHRGKKAKDYRAGSARGEVMRGASEEISRTMWETSRPFRTGTVEILGVDVSIADPAVAQNGQTCVAYGSETRSAQKCNCPARKTIPRSSTNTNRMFLCDIYLIRRSLGKIGCQVKQFAQRGVLLEQANPSRSSPKRELSNSRLVWRTRNSGGGGGIRTPSARQQLITY